MGLHTGLVVESRWDDAEPAVAVVGDVISQAVGLQAQAEPGQILCSSAIAHLVQETVRLEASGPVQVTGQASPMATYAILGSSRRSPGGQHRERGLSPFVGRERELATLHALLAQVEAGRGQVVGVAGEAGIGKSRLISEFYHSLEGRRLTYLTGRCLSYGSATPYLPLLDLLRYNCGITEADGPEDITTKVHRSLQEVSMPPETWAPVFLPLLGVQEGTNQLAALSPAARQARILTAFTQLSLNGSRQRPLVLEIEDLHWIDASSEACLVALVERMAGVPLLLLVTYRPGYRPVWIDKSYVTQMALQPLSPQDSLRVVQAVLPTAGFSTPAVSHLLAQAEGNPFFLEELARMVGEQGAEASSSTMPGTVQTVLMARIDRLPAPTKRLLQAAAVIGKDIALPLLQAVTALPEEAMHRDLLHLQAAEFLYETSTASEVVYTFKHILTQEVAYQSLVRQARQQYHERIAQVLAERFSALAETQPELLAYHYTEAGLSEPATSFWHKAGQRAIQRSAHIEAIRHLTKGLDVLKALPDTPTRMQHELMLNVTLGAPLLATKGYAALEVGAVFMRARELCQQEGDTPQLFQVLQGLWAFYAVRGELQTARELGEQLFSLAYRLHDTALVLEGALRLGISWLALGELVLARAHLEQSLALYNPQVHRSHAFLYGQDPQVSCLCHMALVLWLLGYPTQAMQRSREAVELAQQVSHPFSLAWALLYTALVHTLRREWRAAQEQAATLMALCHEHGFAYRMMQGRILQGWALAQQGQGAVAIAQMQESLATVRTMGAAVYRPYFLALLAEAYRKVDQVKAGLTAVDEGLELIDKTGERFYEAGLYQQKGELLLAPSRANPSEAEASLQHAVTLARQQQAKSLELQAALGLGRLWQRQGKRPQARQLLAEISGWFAEGFDTADLQEAKILLAQLG
jgi:predicted ATPase